MTTSKDIISLDTELNIIGRGFDIYKALLQEVEQRNGTREHMKRILTDAELRRQLAELVVLAADSIQVTGGTGYLVHIDLSHTLVQMIKAGEYGNQSKAIGIITEERFPVDRAGELQYNKKLFLVPPSHDGITTTEWKDELETNDWMLEATPELLALGARYPDLQRDHSIVAFGSFWRSPDGRLQSPNLRGRGGVREAGTDWSDPDIRWNRPCRALVS